MVRLSFRVWGSLKEHCCMEPYRSSSRRMPVLCPVSSHFKQAILAAQVRVPQRSAMTQDPGGPCGGVHAACGTPQVACRQLRPAAVAGVAGSAVRAETRYCRWARPRRCQRITARQYRRIIGVRSEDVEPPAPDRAPSLADLTLAARPLCRQRVTERLVRGPLILEEAHLGRCGAGPSTMRDGSSACEAEP